MPRGHIETDPSAYSYFVTLSLEYSKGPCLIGILAQWQSGIQSISTFLMQWWNYFRSSLFDVEFKFRKNSKRHRAGELTPNPFRNLLIEQARIEHAPDGSLLTYIIRDSPSHLS